MLTRTHTHTHKHTHTDTHAHTQTPTQNPVQPMKTSCKVFPNTLQPGLLSDHSQGAVSLEPFRTLCSRTRILQLPTQRDRAEGGGGGVGVGGWVGGTMLLSDHSPPGVSWQLLKYIGHPPSIFTRPFCVPENKKGIFKVFCVPLFFSPPLYLLLLSTIKNFIP